MISIVIAAHDEAAVIGRTLDRLTSAAGAGELEVVVVANGCTDSTAEVARSRSAVRVVELAEAGKSLALNAGDLVATGFPRAYLDADIAVDADVLRRLAEVLEDPALGALAAVPRRRLDLRGRSLAVRAYFAVHSRLPVVRDGLFGRGLIMLSQDGRSRFDRFPDMVADDLFLDSLFAPEERYVATDVHCVVETPYDVRGLLARLARVRRGNSAMRAASRSGAVGAAVRPSDRWSWLRDVVLPRPWLAPAGLVYVLVTVVAAVRARRGPQGSLEWLRDESTRRG